MNIIILALFIVVVLMFVSWMRNKKEEYSYSFGFPTWRDYNRRWRRNPRGWGWRWRLPWYYGSNYLPINYQRCYEAAKDEKCAFGYKKIGVDVIGDDLPETWRCCRNY